jgi:hypothetical protein
MNSVETVMKERPLSRTNGKVPIGRLSTLPQTGTAAFAIQVGLEIMILHIVRVVFFVRPTCVKNGRAIA